MQRKWIGLLVLFACIAGMPYVGAQQKPPPARQASVLQALQNEYDAAMQKYFEPFTKAKTDEERAKIRLDPNQNPAKTFVPKFQALAQRRKGTEEGARALIMVIQLALEANNLDAAKAAVKELTTSYIKSPALEQMAVEMRYMGYQLGENNVQEILRTIAEKSPHKSVKAAAMFTLGATMLENGEGTKSQTADVRKLFTKLKTDYADTPYAKQADSMIFELENLQIGSVAPDFEAEDQDGVKFKLSDYRGKIVVLDFWGFW